MEYQYILAVLLLANIKPLSLKQTTNEYCSCSKCKQNPWWLVETEFGVIKIGWRKRVINIDWSATGLGVNTDELEKADVTKSAFNIHAWSYSDAVSYLSKLMSMFVSLAVTKEKPNATR